MKKYLVCIFMFLAGVNFTMIYVVFLKRRFSLVWYDSELRTYLFIFLMLVVIIMGYEVFQGYNVGETLRRTVFQVISLQTTTGFLTYDFALWPMPITLLIFFSAIIGPMAGSTGGGLKCIRLVTAYKLLLNEVHHLLHPRAILPVRIGTSTIGGTVIRTVFAFFIIYFILLLFSIIAYLCMGLPLFDAFGISFSLLGNIGPAVGHVVGATGQMNMLPDVGLWWGSFLMLAGRLEIFAVLLPLIPAFWHKD